MLWPRLARASTARTTTPARTSRALAPFTLALLLLVWTAYAILGYALIAWHFAGIRAAAPSFGDAIYFSGTSLTTVGFGDIVGQTAGPRTISIFAAVTGLASSRSRRRIFRALRIVSVARTFVVTVSARAGSPASGVNLLAIAGIPKPRRSQRPDERRPAWAASLGEPYDFSIDWRTFIRATPNSNFVGRYARARCSDASAPADDHGRDQMRPSAALLQYRPARLERTSNDTSASTVRNTARSSARIRSRLRPIASGRVYAKHRDERRGAFKALRSSYAGNVDALAHYFEIPPLQWIGDRSSISRDRTTQRCQRLTDVFSGGTATERMQDRAVRDR